MSSTINAPSYYDRDLVEQHMNVPPERLSHCGRYVRLTERESNALMDRAGLDELDCFSVPPPPETLDLTIEQLWAEARRQATPKEAEIMDIMKPQKLVINRKIDMIAEDDLWAMREAKVQFSSYWSVVAFVGNAMRLKRDRHQMIEALLAKVVEQQNIEGGASFGALFVF